MDLDQFLNLLAAIFGAMGSIYVLKAIATLSPNLIEHLSRTYYGFSIAQIDSLTSQKADSMVGIALVSVALAIVVITNAAVPSGIQMFEQRGVSVVLAAALSAIAYVTLAFAGSAIQKQQRLAVGRIITAQSLGELFQRGQVRDHDVPSFRVYANQLLGISADESEAARSLIGRLAKEVGVAVPDSLDFSTVEVNVRG